MEKEPYLFPILHSHFNRSLFACCHYGLQYCRKKGFHFPVYEDSDEYSQHQFLQPDTSLYYGKDDYLTLMDNSLKGLVDRDSLQLTDENYLNDLEAIYYSPKVHWQANNVNRIYVQFK